MNTHILNKMKFDFKNEKICRGEVAWFLKYFQIDILTTLPYILMDNFAPFFKEYFHIKLDSV